MAETARSADAFRDRYKRFIPEGGAHTTLLRETAEGGSDPGVEIGSLGTEIAGVTVFDWFTAMIDGAETWNDLIDEALE